jgi:hypothetical protein
VLSVRRNASDSGLGQITHKLLGLRLKRGDFLLQLARLNPQPLVVLVEFFGTLNHSG